MEISISENDSTRDKKKKKKITDKETFQQRTLYISTSSQSPLETVQKKRQKQDNKCLFFQKT